MKVTRQAFFLDTGRGRRYCTMTRPQADICGVVFHLPPFAEEMNKSRRMAALCAEALAGRGWCVFRMDLTGTGDSDGDFGDASWQDWLEDIDFAWSWLSMNVQVPQWIWSLRAGSLLLSDWLGSATASPDLLLWQPVSNGRQHLTQFLRLKAASEMLVEADARNVTTTLRHALEAGDSVEIAGYRLAPALASGLGAAQLDLPAGYGGRCRFVEASNTGRGDVSPPLRRLADALSGRGVDVQVEQVEGPAFWQTQEIEVAPALIDWTMAALTGVQSDVV